jgi:competence protein ComEA
MKSDSRIQDLVKAAGGSTESANTLKLNLAKKLKDEDYIYVEKKTNTPSDLQVQSSTGSSTGSSSDNQKININSASKEELKKIPGIGDITAQKIIDYREENGGFKTIQDLKKVGRIGDKTLEKIKDKIDVS